MHSFSFPAVAPRLGIEPSKTSFGGSSVPSTQGMWAVLYLTQDNGEASRCALAQVAYPQARY
jgi:hypothetical protein